MRTIRGPQHRTDSRFVHLLGQTVSVIHKGRKIVGKLEFAGINTKVHGTFQVTLNRTPYWPIDPNTIKLIK